MAHTDAPDDHPIVEVRHETTDADLGITERIIVAMVVVVGLIAAIVWGMYAYLRTEAALSDPRPLPIARGRQGDRVPPLPRLQTRPAVDLQGFRAAEDAALNAYEWVDRQRGIARVPVSRAIDIVAEKGLPRWAPTAPAAPGQPPGAASPQGGQPSPATEPSPRRQPGVSEGR